MHWLEIVAYVRSCQVRTFISCAPLYSIVMTSTTRVSEPLFVGPTRIDDLECAVTALEDKIAQLTVYCHQLYGYMMCDYGVCVPMPPGADDV